MTEGFRGQRLEAILEASKRGDSAELLEHGRHAALLCAWAVQAGNWEEAKAFAADLEWLTTLAAEPVAQVLRNRASPDTRSEED